MISSFFHHRYNLTIVRDIQAATVSNAPTDAASIIASASFASANGLQDNDEQGLNTTESQVRSQLRLPGRLLDPQKVVRVGDGAVVLCMQSVSDYLERKRRHLHRV